MKQSAYVSVTKHYIFVLADAYFSQWLMNVCDNPFVVKADIDVCICNIYECICVSAS